MKPNRRAIMIDAHRQYRQATRLGLGRTFGECLARAWEKHHQRRAEVLAFRTAPRATRKAA
jgi:hypothetical protein